LAEAWAYGHVHLGQFKLAAIFRNYCGVPIQVHPNGETVGLLKLENKQWEEKKDSDGNLNRIERLFREGVLEACDASAGKQLLSRFVEAFTEPETDVEDYEPHSFLARAYLLMEIGHSSRTVAAESSSTSILFSKPLGSHSKDGHRFRSSR